MKRRAFIGTTIGTGAVAAGLAGNEVSATTLSRKAAGQDNKLAGKTLAELREEHRYWLFDDFLPFMDKYVIDHDLGGFMTTVDRDGTQVDSNKRTWFEGRGIWVYSYLYNKIKQDPKYLEAAQKSADFIMKQNPLGKELMPVGFTKEGKPLENAPDPIFYGDVFVANGFQELSRIKGKEKYWDMAKQILLKCVDIYDNRPGYGDLPPKPGFAVKVRSEVKTPAENQPGVERPRVMGHWMVLLNCAQQMLETRTDPEVEKIAKRSVEAIVDYHYNPEYGLINEYLNHDLSRIKTDNYGQMCIGTAPRRSGWCSTKRSGQRTSPCSTVLPDTFEGRRMFSGTMSTEACSSESTMWNKMSGKSARKRNGFRWNFSSGCSVSSSTPAHSGQRTGTRSFMPM